MTDETQLRKYLRARKTLEHKLNDIDRKLDHILYRLRKEDPRVYSDDDQRGEQEEG